MRIITVAERYHPTNDAVIESLDRDREALAAHGHQVTVLTAHVPGIHYADRNVVTVPSLGPLSRDTYHFVLPGLGQVDAVFRRADIVHVHQPLPLSLWAVKHAKAHGVPVVGSYYSEHAAPGATHQGQPKVIEEFLNDLSGIVADRLTSVAELRSAGITVPIHHVTPSIGKHRGQTDPGYLHNRLQLNPTVPIILTEGGAGTAKALSLAIGAVRRLPERPELVIVGNGLTESQIKVAGWQSKDTHVHVIPSVHTALMPSVLASASLFVAPSGTTMQPYSLLEAAAAGLPIVGLDTPTVREFVTNRVTGLLVEPTETALGRAIRQLLYRPALRARMGAAGKQQVEQHHTASARANRLIDCYALVRRMHAVEA